MDTVKSNGVKPRHAKTDPRRIRMLFQSPRSRGELPPRMADLTLFWSRTFTDLRRGRRRRPEGVTSSVVVRLALLGCYSGRSQAG